MFKPKYDNLFEEVQGKIICSSHTVEELKKGNRGPSSRSVGFSVQTWKDVERYPEDLYTGEDSKFNAKILSEGYEPAIAEKAMVYWQMRPSWRDLYKQFYKYGQGDAKATLHTSQLKTRNNQKLLAVFRRQADIISYNFSTFSQFYYPEYTPYNAVILTGLLTIPSLYYLEPLKQVASEKGIKALGIGLAITQLKYWGWFDGFTSTCLKNHL